MGMVAPVYYTADMVRALPDDGNRYEVVHGELLVTPAPRLWHQKLVGRLYQERSVPTYLVVDGDARQVEVWTPEAEFPVLERERLMWLPTGAERAFTLELNELFRAI